MRLFFPMLPIMRAAGFRSLFALALSVCALSAVHAQSSRGSRATTRGRANDDRNDDNQRSDTTFAVPAGITLDVNAASADITVRAWSRNEMQVRGGGAGMRVVNSQRTVHVEVQAGGRNRDNDGKLEVTVPRGTRVSVGSRQGSVNVVDVGGSVDANVISGDVTISGSAERSDVSVASGEVHVTNATGPVHVESISGDIVLEDIRGDVEVSGTSSEVTMRRVRATRVTAQSVSGNVSFDGTLSDNGRYEFSAHSGDVHLSLPESSKGTLEVQTFNGEVHTSIPMTTTGDAPRMALQSNDQGGKSDKGDKGDKGSKNGRASILRGPQRFEFGGGGGAQIIISTFTGDVDVARSSRRSN